MYEFMTELRRDLHRHPELAFEEKRTTEKIAAKLDELGISYRRLEPTGILAEISGAFPGKTVALRADMDALPLTEDSGEAFSSETSGAMHACGHDTHVTMLLGAAEKLNSLRRELHGTVRLIFQPAEENAKGALKIQEQGVLDGVEFLFGIHIATMVPTGSISTCPGPMASAADRFRIIVRGKTCHGAYPENGVDATLAASAIVMNLQSMASREFPPAKPLVVSIGSFHSGSAFNIISGEAVLEGTARCYDIGMHHQLPDAISRIVKNTAAAYRCEAEVEYDMMTEVLYNDPQSYELVRGAALKTVAGPDLYSVTEAKMGAEDFANYRISNKVFANVGAGGTYPLHSNKAVFDEAALPVGADLYAQVALDFLK